jgi:hypothetical protein
MIGGVSGACLLAAWREGSGAGWRLLRFTPTRARAKGAGTLAGPRQLLAHRAQAQVRVKRGCRRGLGRALAGPSWSTVLLLSSLVLYFLFLFKMLAHMKLKKD